MPSADSVGIPSWSYSQLVVDPADKRHGLAPTLTAKLRTSGVAPGSTLNSSINRSCATPDTIAAPLPTRKTATLAGLNEGEGVPVLVRVGVGVVVSAADGDAVDVSVMGGVVDGVDVLVAAAV